MFDSLGYVVVRGPLAEWTRFADEVIGAQAADTAPAGEVHVRLDDHAYRIVVEEGPPAGPRSIVSLGFTVSDAAALDDLGGRLREHGVDPRADETLRSRRGVDGLLLFEDPDGNLIEAVHGQPLATTPFESRRGVRFVTGDLGAGHVFMIARGDSKDLANWYRDVLGFRLTDTIALTALGSDEDAYFLHCNPRHHSIAFARFPGPPPGIAHIMLEVPDFSTVGRIMTNIEGTSDPIVISLGEHSNDGMQSFYVGTPSGFDIEYGCNGTVVDDATWTVTHHETLSHWGHRSARQPA